MRFFVNRYFLLWTCFLLRFGNAQEIDSVWFPFNNFTYCHQGQFDVSSVNRYFDVSDSSYHFNFTSTSNITVLNLNQQGSTSSASMMKLRFGFETIQLPAQQFCPDVTEGCPISINQNFTIQRSYNLSNIPLYPLADITAQYTAIAADSTHLVCITLAPVGYQHPMWRSIFTWLPIGITISAAIISLIASFTIFHDDDAADHDIFLFSSNYAMLPGVLRLKTPGFFDLIFYSQFIVCVGQFNLDYPRFHALFTSNFAWSFLLRKGPQWLQLAIARIFKGGLSDIQNIASVPGNSIYKRQSPVDSTVDNTHSSLNINGTGMADFATALGIDINALFFTMMIYLFLIVGACLVLCFLTYVIRLISGFCSKDTDSVVKSKKIWDFTIGVLVRILVLVYLPLLTLSFYQLMIPSFWYITLLASLFLVIPFLFFGFVSIKLLEIKPRSFVFTQLPLLLRYGTLYNSFTDVTFHFFLAIVVYKSVVAAMIGLFQTSGLAQIILVLLAECALMTGLIYKLPYADSQVNLVYIVLGFIRIVVLSLNLAYIPGLQATSMAKQYIGYVQMSIHCMAFFLFLVLQIKNLVTIFTGLGDDELDETGKPPARMVMWRKRNRPHQRLRAAGSTATLMTMQSGQNASRQSRSYSASFYMGNNESNSNRNSNRLTMDSQTLDMFSSYYGVNNNSQQQHPPVAALKPDEVRRSQPPPVERSLSEYPALVNNYLNQDTTREVTTSLPSTTAPGNKFIDKTVYKLDDDIIPSSEPLMSAIDKSLNKPKPPPLPKHLV